MCQGEAPDVFGFDEDADQVTVLQEHPDESLRPQVQAAVRYCPAMALSHRGGLMYDRAEMDAFWERWLAANRTAEADRRLGPMADFYTEDATYGWMYTPDEHFMAVGREQIREWALGLEMAGLDGWHYDYAAHRHGRDQRDDRRLLEAAGRDHRRQHRPGVRDPRHRRLVVRLDAATGSPGSGTGSTSAVVAHDVPRDRRQRQGAAGTAGPDGAGRALAARPLRVRRPAVDGLAAAWWATHHRSLPPPPAAAHRRQAGRRRATGRRTRSSTRPPAPRSARRPTPRPPTSTPRSRPPGARSTRPTGRPTSSCGSAACASCTRRCSTTPTTSGR